LVVVIHSEIEENLGVGDHALSSGRMVWGVVPLDVPTAR
jgi:hypothetical protein